MARLLLQEEEDLGPDIEPLFLVQDLEHVLEAVEHLTVCPELPAGKAGRLEPLLTPGQQPAGREPLQHGRLRDPQQVRDVLRGKMAALGLGQLLPHLEATHLRPGELVSARAARAERLGKRQTEQPGQRGGVLVAVLADELAELRHHRLFVRGQVRLLAFPQFNGRWHRGRTLEPGCQVVNLDNLEHPRRLRPTRRSRRQEAHTTGRVS
ncbi:MAG: hypothetical protein M5U12_26820 [Verrucomicrobia bacterium]|nr:hypothetical protein [Verrucomicrobiota bacterium]